MCKSNIKPWLCALLGLWLLSLPAFAQQDPQYSQYAFNVLTLNPAYAGSREAMSMTGLWRNQWRGYEGAPNTASFSIHAPTHDLRHGVGLSLVSDHVGPTSTNAVDVSYAYRIPTSKHGWLALGLQGELANYSVNYHRVRLDQQSDAVLSNASFNRWLPNAGVGLWYNDRRLFGGLSMPRLIPSNLSPMSTGGDTRRVLHGFGMVGYVFDLGKSLKLRPSVMAKWAQHAPASVDLNLGLLIQDRLWVGGTYRTSHAMALMAQAQLTQFLRIGYSYDMSTEALRRAGSSTHELMLGLDLKYAKNKLVSPRYF